mmetsp:Transcript_42002/g.111379  ORF Transcript_42002/g.111379 Transcript_42002/m.111379 type:complete len:249 (+) Transcript_42002:1504-2250(+)
MRAGRACARDAPCDRFHQRGRVVRQDAVRGVRHFERGALHLAGWQLAEPAAVTRRRLVMLRQDLAHDDQHGDRERRHKVGQRLGQPQQDHANQHRQAALFMHVTLLEHKHRQHADTPRSGGGEQQRPHLGRGLVRGLARDGALRRVLAAVQQLGRAERLQRRDQLVCCLSVLAKRLRRQARDHRRLALRPADVLVELLDDLADALVVEVHKGTQLGTLAPRIADVILLVDDDGRALLVCAHVRRGLDD